MGKQSALLHWWHTVGRRGLSPVWTPWTPCCTPGLLALLSPIPGHHGVQLAAEAQLSGGMYLGLVWARRGSAEIQRPVSVRSEQRCAVSTNASVFPCVLSAWRDYLVPAALLFGWPEALGWRGGCKVHTARGFCVTVGASSFVCLRKERLNLRVIQL